MDTQNSSIADVPNMKLAKVGKDRDKKRGGGGWLNGRGLSSGFSGAAGGAGAGGAGGLFGVAGMSVGKILLILLVSGVVSAGAWKAGDMMANSIPSDKAPSKKAFEDKNAGKYADTSGVIKQENNIPNSLGYINNDGLTDEQRAAKKAAEEAAAKKAADDAQKAADEEAKKKALEDAKAASATPDAAPAGGAGGAPAEAAAARKGLSGGKFGGLGSGGGGGLSGGAGMSGGIGRGFGGAEGLGKANKGALSSFKSPSAASASKVAHPGRTKSNAKGFARQQLDQAFGASRNALATGKSESASAGAAAPFDNNAAQGSVIAGPGLGNGTKAGPADSGGSGNQQDGGGGGGSPLGSNDAACDVGYNPDITGTCQPMTTPDHKDAAPYQGLIDAVLVLMAIVLAINIVALAFSNAAWFKAIAVYLAGVMAAIGAAIAVMGSMIALMKHGDFMIGGIIAVVGGFITVQGLMAVTGANSMSGTPMTMANQAAPTLLATAAGALATGSAKASMQAAQMQ